MLPSHRTMKDVLAGLDAIIDELETQLPGAFHRTYTGDGPCN